MKPSQKLNSWQRTNRALDYERERLAFLKSPLPKNDPELFTPTRCRVLKAFCIGGKPVTVGEVIVLAKCDALSLQAISKIEIIK